MRGAVPLARMEHELPAHCACCERVCLNVWLHLGNGLKMPLRLTLRSIWFWTTAPCHAPPLPSHMDLCISCCCSLTFHGLQDTPCTASPCLNGGMCEVTDAGVKCTCMSGYSGALCEV